MFIIISDGKELAGWWQVDQNFESFSEWKKDIWMHHRGQSPKGAEDKVKRPKGPTARSQGPEGPKTFSYSYWSDLQVGKWHLGHSKHSQGPVGRGFDRHHHQNHNHIHNHINHHEKYWWLSIPKSHPEHGTTMMNTTIIKIKVKITLNRNRNYDGHLYEPPSIMMIISKIMQRFESHTGSFMWDLESYTKLMWRNPMQVKIVTN